MVCNAAKMTAEPQREKRSNDLGPIGKQVAANVRRYRDGSSPRLSTQELANRMTSLGRPIAATGITRIEAGQRRVDADDLVALAVALEVSPILLLLPPEESAGDVAVTPTRTTSWVAAWRWATGDQPLLDRGEEVPDARAREFMERNRPHARNVMHEARRVISSQYQPPYTVTIINDGESARSRIRLGHADLSQLEIVEEDTDGER